MSVKHEIRLASKAEYEAAEAAAAATREASQELHMIVPSSVTKAIAGLATPHLPSPSIFPEDWRMFSELLHDGPVSNQFWRMHTRKKLCIEYARHVCMAHILQTVTQEFRSAYKAVLRWSTNILNPVLHC